MPQSMHEYNYNKLLVTVASMCMEKHSNEGKTCYIDSLHAEPVGAGMEVIMIVTFWGDEEELMDMLKRCAAASNAEIAYFGKMFSHRYIVHIIVKWIPP